jgi:SAM-dependent methyltransferase
MTNYSNNLSQALWKIYNRSDNPHPTDSQIDRFWRDPAFSERVLSEHLDDEHGAASRPDMEQQNQIDWLWQKLSLTDSAHLFDVTCGPGLYAVKFARKGCQVTGVDFNPTAIAYAKDLALSEGLTSPCNFVEQDIRAMNYAGHNFDAALFLYAQLESFDRPDALKILKQIADSLKPGGKLCLEMLNQDHVDKTNSSWWYTDDQGLWGDAPFLHLGERFWYADEEIAVERYHIIHLETGQIDKTYICNQTYSIQAMTTMLKQAGFDSVQVYPAWDGLSLYDAEEWIVYIGEKSH